MENDERTDRREVRTVATMAALISISAFLIVYLRGEVLLYGDAVAHINIARRVFDSHTPGPLQLGTVWLPLPHVVMIPFVVNDWMWRTGIGGSIPSMIAYVLGCVGIFSMLRLHAGRSSAAFGTAIYGLNPNLLYMQSTAMTESIFLAATIWSVHYLQRFVLALRDEKIAERFAPYQSVERCGTCLGAAILTRYDGWVLAAVCGAIIVWKWLRTETLNWSADSRRRVTRAMVSFLALCALVPLLWLAHNYALSAQPLDFLNGPYSAKAIEARTTQPGGPSHPGTGNLLTSAIFFLKAAKLNASGGWLEPVLFLLAVLGTAFAAKNYRRFGTLLVLWLPLPFYAYSVAYGSVPIFMPVWWPHSYYNVRYGLELLPAFAIFVGIMPRMIAEHPVGRWRRPLTGAVCLVAMASYGLVLAQVPICLREARANSVSRLALESKLAAILSKLPSDSTILMQTGEYVGALQDAGIHLSRVVWEGDHPRWDNALAAPAKYADYVVAYEGSDVWYATRLFPEHLVKIAEFDTPEKPHVSVYQAKH